MPDGGGQSALDVGAEGLFKLSGEVVIAEQVSQRFGVVWPVFFSGVGGWPWRADPRGRWSALLVLLKRESLQGRFGHQGFAAAWFCRTPLGCRACCRRASAELGCRGFFG
jgi:hypothetical protein